jgi:hypothetical protein
MPFPDESLTVKSAVQDPAPPFTTGTSAAPCDCGTGKELRAKVEIDTISRPASQPASHILCEVRIRTPPQTETIIQVPTRLPRPPETIPESRIHWTLDSNLVMRKLANHPKEWPLESRRCRTMSLTISRLNKYHHTVPTIPKANIGRMYQNSGVIRTEIGRSTANMIPHQFEFTLAMVTQAQRCSSGNRRIEMKRLFVVGIIG